MGGVNTTQLLASTGDPIEQPVLVRGYVSTVRPAPISFSEPVWVIVPGYSTDRPLGPCEWPAIHGASLPLQGAECVVGFDDQHKPTLVWWSGAYDEPKLPDSGWIEPTLLNSWKNVGGIYPNIAYRKQGNVVRLRGNMSGGANNSEVFSLPAGYRPTGTEFFCIVTNVEPGTVDPRLEITSAGSLHAIFSGAPAVRFDGITFTID